ncbi:SUMO-specific isopeptidase USPL1 [Anomaloglossus baeobatrachus]|uniref:SUMO-specific isopeptidase USPL1 n=1 Tax=Anomaloglossus baeobatrachus TaxID=238106 RepID=UPI003F4FEFC4
MSKNSQWVTTMASKTPGSTVSLPGQGSFLDKPSLHMVGYLGKNSLNINAPHVEWCPVCKTKGQTQALKTYRINITQSIFLCTSPQCIYPLGYTPLDNIIANTADLKKKSSPQKRKKCNNSDLLPTPLVAEKRPKIDLPTFGDTLNIQDDLCKSAPDFPTLERETSSPTGLQHGQKDGTVPQVQNGSGTTNPLSSSGLWDMSDIPILSTRSFSRHAPDQPEMQNGSQEVLKKEDLEVNDTLNNSSPLLLPPETGQVASKEEKVMTETLNQDHKLNGPAFRSDGIACCVPPPTPPNRQPECQLMENSSKEVPFPPCNILSDLESELPPMCTEQAKEYIEKMDDSTNKVDVVSLLTMDTPGDRSGNSIISALLHEETDQQMNLSSLLDISLPSCPDDAVQDCSFGTADVSESLELMQECGEKTEEQSDRVQECSEESQHLWKPVSSPLLQDGEKSQSTFTSCELEKHQSERLSKDKSDTTSLEPDGSMLSTDDPSVRIPNLSLLQELVQKCQSTYSAENSPPNLLQNALPESKEEEKSLKDTCDSQTTAALCVIDQACANAAAISSPAKTLDETQLCQKSSMASPTESLKHHEPVCLPDDSSLERVRESHDPSTSMREAYTAITDVNSPNKMSLLNPQVLLQDCVKCHCGMSVPSQSLHEDTGDSPLSPSPVEDDHSYAKHPLSEVQVLLRDCLKCHCGNSQVLDTSFSSEVCNINMVSDHEEVSAQSDCSVDAAVEDAASLTDRESMTSKKKEKVFENTILPDLLLDIQPEHRLEEPISAAHSPMCYATQSDTWEDGKDKMHEHTMANDIIQDDGKLTDALDTSLNSDGVMADDSDDDMEVESEGPAQGVAVPTAKKTKPEEKRLQWKNKHNLCWLDCILSALVHSETLNNFVSGGYHDGKESLIPELFARFNEATGIFLKSLALKKRKADHKRPKYEKCLHELRMNIFEKLQPLLKCKLGKKESPVFAFPLLLRLDPQTENLFMHSFVWEFKCEVCGYSYQQRCQKSLTTFTKVIPEWLPLNAVHLGPCNRCRHPKQKRAMVLEKLNSFFMVHFVEGSPTNDVNKLSFQFQGHVYEVKTIIKYNNNHFSSWILNLDGSWLESDGLRGSFCRRYQKIKVRADVIHIVIWERRGGKSFEDNVQFGAVEQEVNSENVSSLPDDPSFSSVGTAELSQQVAPAVPSVDLNTSDPLAGMEGYADDDVITLTLVEIPTDANGCPIDAPAKLQETEASRSIKADLGEGANTAQLKMSTNVHPESQEDTTRTSSFSSQLNPDISSLMNYSVERTPLKQSPLKPANKTIATSTPSPQPYNQKKSIVGNWMSRLIRKNNSILNSDPLAANGRVQCLQALLPLKVTDSSDVPKKAQNFNGFLARSTSKPDFPPSNVFPSSTASKSSFNVPTERGTAVGNPISATSDFKTPSNNGLDYRKTLKEGSSSSEDKIRRLRLKLLKKLKSKKNELATLETLVKRQENGSVGAQANSAPRGGFNRKEHLRGFLQELQEQLDNADNESVCTMSSSASICSSPGDAEFFAELFSPSSSDSQPNDSRYLEMLADGHLHLGSGGTLQSTSGSNSCPTASKLNSPAEDGSLNPMSSSTVAVLHEDNYYFDFDEYF